MEYSAMATLLTLGGLDSRPRIGGDVIETGLRTGREYIRTNAIELNVIDDGRT